MLESIPYSVVVIVAVALSATCVLAALLHRFGRIVPERGAVPLLVLANDADFDGDGLSDADEVLLHFTNPRLADSDLDGSSDWREIHYGTDPFDPDEDGDGVPDGVAPAAWYGNALWATNATDGVIVTVTLNHAIPAGARAAFMLDDLSIPLRAPASWCFAFEPGVPHDYRLFVSDGATADLSITAADPGQAHGPLLRGAEATPLWAEGDGGVFDGPSPGGAGKAAVPRLEFTYHVAGAMAHQRGGSLCLHGGDRVTFEANVLPAEIGAEWELENLREIDGALALYVPDDGMGHAGRATLAGGTLREGGLSFDFAAHRFEMARTGPFCAVCGCYEPVDAALGIFPRTLTLKYDDVATLSIGHAGSPGVEYADVRFEVRQPGYTGWLAIPGNTWKARIAGTFQVRGFATADGREVEVGPENVWVRFPSEAEMMAEPAVQAHAAELWAQTLLLCTATSRRELGCWIRLDTATGTYSFTDTLPGPEALNDQEAFIDFGTPPPDIPLHPNLQHESAVYTVSAFHTHTPTTYRSPGDPRIVGPSGVDGHNSQTQQIPSIVYDYVESPALAGGIPMGYPANAPVQLYQTGVCPRRINP